MTSKQPKKSNKKKAPVTNKKKAPAKKAPAKKVSAPKSTAKAIVRPEDSERLLSKVSEAKPQFVTAEKLVEVMAQHPTLIRANDLKSPSLRKRMLAWFKLSK